MVTKREAMNADVRDHTLRDTAFVAGADEGVSVPAERVAELAYLEVGETASVREFIAMEIGQRPDPQLRSAKGKAFANLFGPDGDADGNPDELPRDLQVKLITRERGERGGRDLTPYIPLGELWDTDEAGVYPLGPRKPVVRGNRIIALHAKLNGDPDVDSFQYSHADSKFKWPARGGK